MLDFKKFPQIFIFSLLLFLFPQFIIVNMESFWSFCYFWSNPIEDDGIRFEAKLRTMHSPENYRKVFLLGSSQTREDFDAQLLNRDFANQNLDFYNFGISGGQPIDMFMLKRKIVNQKPSIIIYMSSVRGIYSDYKFSKLKYYFDPEIISFFVKDKQIWSMVSKEGAIVDSFLAKALILFKYRESIKKIFYTMLKNILMVERRTEPVNYGYTTIKPESYYLGIVKKGKIKDCHIGRFSDLNKELFIIFAKYCISKNIKFVVIDGPTHPLMRKIYEKELFRDYSDFFKKVSNDLGFVFITKDQLPRFSKGDYADFTHLSETGRLKLTQFLKEYIKKQLI